MQKALLLRVGSIVLLTLLLLVPLGMIRSIVAERQQLQQQVENTVASSFAGSQRLIGPVLIVPYVERELVVSTDDRGKETKRNVEHQRRLLIVPTLLNYDGAAEIEARHKGIYKALVYQTKGAWRARFDVPASFGIDLNPAHISIGTPYLAFGMSDVRGIRGTPSITWAGHEVTVSSGTKFDALGDGLHAEVGDLTAREARQYEAVVNIDVAGTRSLAFAPVGKSVAVQLRAPWPHPNFGGRFLPLSKKIDADGFSARWDVSHLSSKNDDLLLRGAKEQAALETFDVSFIEPVNIYQQAERAVKYGILFVALTFAAFFLFETLKDLRIHAMQYGLVGLALAVFFLLLVSLSEHVSFLSAYVIASVCCVLLIGYYLAHVLQGWRRGAVFGAKLIVLYGVLYGLLLSEDNALMLGSLLLFAALAVFMVLTRRLDWYQLGSIKGGLPKQQLGPTST
ncbi:MAG: cell envelope integrity protein CreD [Usitatibacteraceae bacterium]